MRARSSSHLTISNSPTSVFDNASTDLARPAELAEAGGKLAGPLKAAAYPLFSFSPNEGERSAENGAGVLGDTPGRTNDGHARGALRRRPASPCDRGRAPSRRSTVAIFDRGPRFRLRH